MLEKESLLSIRHQRKRKLTRCGLPWMRYATSSWWRIGLRDAGGSPCAIAFEGLTKRYGGTVVLDGVSADLEKGKIHGLIGRNGSGKTVLLKCLCGLTRFDEGCVKIRGRKELPFNRLPAGIGVIIEAPGFSPQYSGMRNLLHLAKLQNRAGKDEVRQAMAAGVVPICVVAVAAAAALVGCNTSATSTEADVPMEQVAVGVIDTTSTQEQSRIIFYDGSLEELGELPFARASMGDSWCDACVYGGALYVAPLGTDKFEFGPTDEVLEISLADLSVRPFKMGVERMRLDRLAVNDRYVFASS